MNLLKKVAFAFVLLCLGTAVYAQQAPVTKANYELAERFSSKKVGTMVFSTTVVPHWFKNSDKFWYNYKTGEGTKYYIVDPSAGTKKEIWDMAELAAEISEITKDPFDAQHLPIRDLKLVDDKYFTFYIQSNLMVPKKEKKVEGKEGEAKKESKPARPVQKEKKKFQFQYNIATGELLDITDQEEEEKNYPAWANVSPDGSYAIFSKKFNIWYMDKENLEKAMENSKDTTIVEIQLTTDGTKDFSYGSSRGSDPYATEKDFEKRSFCPAVWSPDSKHFALVRSDRSKIKDLWVINVLANPRPRLESYKYQMPGEPSPKQYLYLFNMESKEGKVIKTDAFKDQSLSIRRAPMTHAHLYNKYNPSKWLGDNNKFYISRTSRDLKRVDICTVNVDSDSCNTVIEERLNTYVETRDLKVINNGAELIHWSERDGWAHLYLYGADGKLKNRITKGDFHVEEILGIDQARRVVYFTACGKDKSLNPYYMHLYSANLDGSNMKLLNKGDFDSHDISVCDDTKYFVSNHSRVDTTPESALYDNTGRKIMDLETADLSRLFASGYKFPEIFTVKAGDGVTDLYGVMYKPFDFDSTKHYPIIEYVYPGPQTEANNSHWSKSMDRIDRLAQLGFIVVTVGNRGGHPNRSKWYHNFGYGNLRDYGLEDKKVVVQQLAARHKFINGKKVGIHGHSGGGFMSTAAILKYPDFFTAAVSCAGNHDNSIYNRWWSEQHHGILEEITAKGDTTFKYSINTNQQIAPNLKGHLLLVTGDVDNNVHPGGTIRVVNALIRANKRFDLLVLPGQRHSFGDMTEYFFWRMADHFSKYLMDDNTPRPVDIPEMNNN
ncbi:MAG: DPP IV N-terminal domain-containing protein [Bacteroidales bacterium]|nr:DPP IV N-terminal domain-containing protein [Bacteroidales bacterium]